MKNPEKNTEGILKSVIRSVITAGIISLILTFTHVIKLYATSKLETFGIIWLIIFCIVYGGHWLEVLFINKIKLMLPQNSALVYLSRIVYWFLCAILLLIVAKCVGNVLTNKLLFLGHWWTFGLFYIGIELLMHAMMQLQYKKSFYNGIY